MGGFGGEFKQNHLFYCYKTQQWKRKVKMKFTLFFIYVSDDALWPSWNVEQNNAYDICD